MIWIRNISSWTRITILHSSPLNFQFGLSDLRILLTIKSLGSFAALRWLPGIQSTSHELSHLFFPTIVLDLCWNKRMDGVFFILYDGQLFPNVSLWKVYLWPIGLSSSLSFELILWSVFSGASPLRQPETHHLIYWSLLNRLRSPSCRSPLAVNLLKSLNRLSHPFRKELILWFKLRNYYSFGRLWWNSTFTLTLFSSMTALVLVRVSFRIEITLPSTLPSMQWHQGPKQSSQQLDQPCGFYYSLEHSSITLLL